MYTMVAYHGDANLKTLILDQLARHREADEIIKGTYWHNGKGCAVGCTIYGSEHVQYESQFGIPKMLALLEDRIFEGLSNAEAKQWPERFMGAVRPGADLSLVGWKFYYCLLTDETINPSITDPLAKDMVRNCANVLLPLTEGLSIEKETVRITIETVKSGMLTAGCSEWFVAGLQTLLDDTSAEIAMEKLSWMTAIIVSIMKPIWSPSTYSKMADKLITLIETA